MVLAPRDGVEKIKQEFVEGAAGHVVRARYFYFDMSQAENAPFYILCGGYEKCAPDFYLNRRNLPFYSIKYILNGKGVFVYRDKSYPLLAGSLALFEPRAPHQFKADPADPMEHLFVVFTGKTAERVCAIQHLHQRHCIRVQNPEWVGRLMWRIFEIGLEKPPNAQFLCQQYVQCLLLEPSEPTQRTAWQSGALETFLRCKQRIDLRFAAIKSVAQAADECGVDIRYLARLFRRFEKMRPYDYLMRLKINKAANLLLTTALNIKQIGLMTGFEDPLHFSRLFKKYANLSPSAYRKRGLS